ncbi:MULTISPECIES: prolipoprotein diacylglyceryl transferase [Sulfurospirillum]|jgi:phosphatidylglycerol:prolipoprotein diacylglycerol transferase|uniref:prolipoprotein diacylglyceryl transferase n=1 Tax=Sulfurospirillum TaxID=57665 RepID=UPI0005A9CF5D|nr:MULTISPECIES: prolipoprotein diacylglyceryl transferase [Sulfurospirillum]MCP3652086.1 prolipoprotein diacylglyceryl transferase [Sulfurospirillum sp. DNRA8]MCR1810934.1 prolipoprotein diacylglyceryl transferase [Sulfurospirillum sp. DNRA8]
MPFWNHIYAHFDPVAFKLGPVAVHWYGLMYMLALLGALYAAKFFVKKDALGFSNQILESYFIWIEIGIVLGARIGYILFYDPHLDYYLAHPWQMFNPFMDGTFVGIRGMSYHGAIVGFLLGTWFFYLKYKVNIWRLLDLVALSVPVGYIFGRIGNFLNQELFGRVTDVPWGIYVDGVLRHPSQLYEALLEGLAVFLLLYMYRSSKKFDGELIALYGLFYSLARFTAEFWREPDFQIGFVYGGWMSKGQALSLVMAVASLVLYGVIKRRTKRG